MAECPVCWSPSYDRKEYDFKYYYVTECQFCGNIQIVPKMDIKELRDYDATN